MVFDRIIDVATGIAILMVEQNARQVEIAAAMCWCRVMSY